MAFVFRQGDLPKLDLQVDRGTDFKAWKSQWEAYLEGDTVEDLLAEKDLTLEKTVTKCRAQEAAKRQRAEMAGTGGAAIQLSHPEVPNPYLYRQQNPTYNQVGKTCQGCGASPHQGGQDMPRMRC